MTPAVRWDDPDPIYLDFETQSACDLKAVGGRLYAQHPSTRVLSLVVDAGGEYHVWVPVASQVHPDAVATAGVERYGIDPARVRVYAGPMCPAPIVLAAKSGRTLVAHNALGFDRFVWERFVGLPVVWCDTLYLARLAGLPGGLDQLSRAALSAGKDAAKKLVMGWTRAEACPDGYAPGKKRAGQNVTEVVNGVRYVAVQPGQIEVLLRYNLVDVIRLRELYEGPLATVAVEGDVIAAHLAVNERGVAADPELLNAVTAISNESTARAGEQLSELTGGRIGKHNYRSGPQIHAWLAERGVRLKTVDAAGAEKQSLRKDVIDQALADPRLMLDAAAPFAAVTEIDPVVFDVLRLRSAALRITAAKTVRASACLSDDGRLRDLHTYHQAHTGRDSSNRVQVQNLPRPLKGLDVNALLEAFDRGELSYDHIAGRCREWTAKLREKTPGAKAITPDDALSAIIRPCLRAAPGKALAVCDFAAVECRGLAWAAGEETLLEAFRTGTDVYKITGSRIFGKPADQIDDYERQVAKVVTLGCGYGLGAEKFRLYAAAAGIDLVKAGVTAEQCIDAFRAAYPAVAGTPAGVINGRIYRRGGVWTKLEKAAMAATAEGGVHEAARCRWMAAGGTLVCELPSGRRLNYRDARVEDHVPGYVWALGLEPRAKATLVYNSPRGYPAMLYGGKIAENVVQALCRDLLVAAMARAEDAGIPVVLRVHDELVCEVPANKGPVALEALARIMSTPPAWAAGFPLACEGYLCERYVKKPPAGALTAVGVNGRVELERA